MRDRYKNKVIYCLFAVFLMLVMSTVAIGRIDIYGSISEYKCTGTSEGNITFYNTTGNDSVFCFYSDEFGTKIMCLDGSTGDVTIHNNLTVSTDLDVGGDISVVDDIWCDVAYTRAVWIDEYLAHGGDPDTLIWFKNNEIYFKVDGFKVLELLNETSTFFNNVSMGRNLTINAKLQVDGDINSTGNINCSGKITAGGGVDPPYVLYNRENLISILTRINKEIPPNNFNKWGGQVMYYDADIDNMCILNPDSGNVREFVWKSDYDALEDRVDILEMQMQQLMNGGRWWLNLK